MQSVDFFIVDNKPFLEVNTSSTCGWLGNIVIILVVWDANSAGELDWDAPFNIVLIFC